MRKKSRTFFRHTGQFVTMLGSLAIVYFAVRCLMWFAAINRYANHPLDQPFLAGAIGSSMEYPEPTLFDFKGYGSGSWFETHYDALAMTVGCIVVFLLAMGYALKYNLRITRRINRTTYRQEEDISIVPGM